MIGVCSPRTLRWVWIEKKFRDLQTRFQDHAGTDRVRTTPPPQGLGTHFAAKSRCNQPPNPRVADRDGALHRVPRVRRPEGPQDAPVYLLTANPSRDPMPNGKDQGSG